MQIVRTILVALGIVLVACGVVLIIRAPIIWFAGLELILAGLVFIVGVGFERARYRARNSRNSSGWVSTGEKFVDPTTGKTTEVYYDAKTGERSYRT